MKNIFIILFIALNFLASCADEVEQTKPVKKDLKDFNAISRNALSRFAESHEVTVSASAAGDAAAGGAGAGAGHEDLVGEGGPVDGDPERPAAEGEQQADEADVEGAGDAMVERPPEGGEEQQAGAEEEGRQALPVEAVAVDRDAGLGGPGGELGRHEELDGVGRCGRRWGLHADSSVR